MIHGLGKDLRFAVATLVRRPLFALGVLSSFGLVLAANTTVFSFVNTLLLRPPPVEEPDRLVRVFTVAEGAPDLYGLSFPNFEDYRRSGEVFEDLAVFRRVPLALATGGDLEMIEGEIVSSNYFELLGIRAARGATFSSDGRFVPGGSPVAVLSHDFWRRRFGGDPDAVGGTLRLSGHEYSIVGVAPEGFRGVNLLSAPDLWVPMEMHAQVLTGRLASWFEFRDAMILNGLGRLRPGLGLEEASAGAEAMARRLEAAHPVDNEGLTLTLYSLADATIHPDLRSKLALASTVILATVLLLLVIASANVANLLLAHSVQRRREIAVRLALGAGRGRLLRQLLVEGALLAVASAAVGTLLAFWGRHLLLPLRPSTAPESLDFSFDLRVAGFVLGVTVLTGVLFGLVPGLQTLRPDVVGSLKLAPGESEPRRLGPRNLLVVGQVAMTLVALITAGLFAGSLRQALRADLGFEPDGLMVATLDLGAAGYEAARGEQLQRRLLEELSALPAAASVALGERAPLEPRPVAQVGVQAVGAAPPPGERAPPASVNSVSPGFLETVGISLLRGRDLSWSDGPEQAPVAVVNRSLAELLWPGDDPVGRRFEVEGEESPYEVVGLIEDFEYRSAGVGPEAYFLRSTTQRYLPDVTLHVRTAGPPERLLPEIRRTVRSLDGDLPVLRPRTMASLRDEALWGQRVATVVLALFGGIALVIATTGLYCLLTYTVSSRAREIGIRTALGASRRDLVRLVLGRGVWLVAAGVGAGAVASAVVVSLLRNRISGLDLGGPGLYLGAAALLVVTSFLAMLLPARWTARLDPTQALRKT